jgi:hypothetical protein
MAREGKNVYDETSKSETEALEKQQRRAERRLQLEQEMRALEQKDVATK